MKEAPQRLTALDESTRMLMAFADPVRLRLLSLLSGERKEVCVCHSYRCVLTELVASQLEPVS